MIKNAYNSLQETLSDPGERGLTILGAGFYHSYLYSSLHVCFLRILSIMQFFGLTDSLDRRALPKLGIAVDDLLTCLPAQFFSDSVRARTECAGLFYNWITGKILT